MRRSRSALVVVSLALAALVGAACSSQSSATDDTPTVSTLAPEVRAFYEIAPADVAGAPGTVVRTQAIDAPPGSRGWRVLYRSRAIDEREVVTSGLIFAPSGVAPSGVAPSGVAPSGGRPVVAWAHETTGIADDCAPSHKGEATLAAQDLRAFLAKGYVVTATDYEGLGTPGTHPYLVGASEAHSVLDSIRAAANLTETGAGTRAAIYGYSQGGHATLFAAQYAPTYAPELTIVGSAAVAPPADLSKVAVQLGTSRQLYGFGVLTAFGINAAYPNEVPLANILAPEIVEQSSVVEETCSQFAFFAIAARPFNKVFNPAVVTDPTVARVLAENSAGATPPEGPVLILNGGRDELATPAMVETYVQRVCPQGAQVEVITKADRDHGSILRDDFAAVGPWIEARFAGDALPAGCPIRR